MLRPAAKFLATIVCSLTIFASVSAPTQAGVVPCVWNFLFGPCRSSGCGYSGGCYSGGCNSGCCSSGGYAPIYGSPAGGCSSGGCGTTYYGPVSYYGGGCSSCGSRSCVGCYTGNSYSGCSGSSCGSCGSPVCSTFDGTCGSSGSCGAGGCDSGCSSGIPATAAPSTNAPPPRPVPMPPPSVDRSPGDTRHRTFEDNNAAPPAGPGVRPDAGFEPKKPAASLPAAEDEGGFRARTPAASGDAGTGKAARAADEDTIPKPVDKPADNTTNKPTVKPPATDPIKKEEEKRTDAHIQPLNLGDKIVWDDAPVRSNRREIRFHVANARLIRVPVFPSTDWIPQADPATIAKK